MDQKKSIPLWIIIVCSLLGLLSLVVGCSLFIAPGSSIEHVDFSQPEIKNLADMWAVRQVSIAVIILYSLIRRSVPMLKISLIAYGLMTFMDGIIGIINQDVALAIGSLFFCAIAVIVMWRLKSYQD